MEKIKVLDLFCGHKGWSEPFKRRGHVVFTVDVDPAFHPNLAIDVMKLRSNFLPWKPDIILASPPCERFSVLQLPQGHFTKIGNTYHVNTIEAREAISLVEKTVDLIYEIDPQYFVMENPRAMLRKLGVVPFERREVWYCHYGEKRAKPTDLWGGFPPSLELKQPCHNMRKNHPSDCCCRDHNYAPRGSTSGGSQGMDGAISAKIPKELAIEVCLSVENDLGI